MDGSHDGCEPRWVLPDRVLSDETDRQLTDARRMLGDLQVELATRAGDEPPTPRRSPSRCGSSTSSSSWSSSASSTPARARSSMPSSAARCSTRASPRRRRRFTSSATARRPRPNVLGSGIRVGHRARRLPQGHPHRRHAGHERDHPRARAPDDRVRAAGRFRPVRDLRRPAVHRDRSASSSKRFAPGARKSWSSSTRSTSSSARRSSTRC